MDNVLNVSTKMMLHWFINELMLSCKPHYNILNTYQKKFLMMNVEEEILENEKNESFENQPEKTDDQDRKQMSWD